MAIEILERSAESCEILLMAAQKARSNAIEACGGGSIGHSIMLDLNPMLGDGLIDKLAMLAERGPTELEWANLARLVSMEPSLAICLISCWGCDMPEPGALVAS